MLVFPTAPSPTNMQLMVGSDPVFPSATVRLTSGNIPASKIVHKITVRQLCASGRFSAVGDFWGSRLQYPDKRDVRDLCTPDPQNAYPIAEVCRLILKLPPNRLDPLQVADCFDVKWIQLPGSHPLV